MFIKTVLVFCFCILFIDKGQAHSDFVEIIPSVKTSVVTLDVSLKKRFFKSKINKQREEALGEYADFYRDDFKQIASKSKGSGFVLKTNNVINGDVYILTAAHVIKNASKINVTFANGITKKAGIVWVHVKSDVALLSLSYPAFTGGLELSNNKVLEGEPVLSISGAFGISLSSSVGIVSAKDVVLKGKSKVGLLQTDAAINPGSSGGPLFNSKGKVIGLISNIFSKTGTFSGAAFAVPASKLKELIDSKN